MPADATIVHPVPPRLGGFELHRQLPAAEPDARARCTCRPAPGWPTSLREGYLIAGVDQSTNLWAYRNPTTGQLQGFDIDMLEQVNEAIFGPNAPAIDFKIVPNARSEQGGGDRRRSTSLRRR